MCLKKALLGAGIGEAPVQRPSQFYKLEVASMGTQLAELDEA